MQRLPNVIGKSGAFNTEFSGDGRGELNFLQNVKNFLENEGKDSSVYVTINGKRFYCYNRGDEFLIMCANA